MGSSASKQGGNRRGAARDSWYALLTRSISVPLHYLPREDDDRFHVQTSLDLASDFHGMTMMNRLQGKQIEKKWTNEIDAEVFSKKTFFGSELKPVQETVERDENFESIDNWELMEGLEEEEEKEGKEQEESLFKGISNSRADDSVFSLELEDKAAGCGAIEKSLSFNTVHGLDSCFSEIGTPVWQSDTLHMNPDEDRRRQSMSTVVSKQYGHKMPRARVGSLLKRSLSPNIPLFDPSLIAKFEQALEGINFTEGDWMLLDMDHSQCSASCASAPISASNTTFTVSEASSDAESECSSNVGDDKQKMWILPSSSQEMKRELSLYSFELRCPPRGEDKVVLYFTSLRGVRRTYEDCCLLRLILQGMGVRVDERDVWMHSAFREELKNLLDTKTVPVPRLFIKGRYIGGAEEVKQLHEEGLLSRLIEDLTMFGVVRKMCEGCADMRFIPCLTCSGSCKVLDTMDDVIRCPNCNENGLIMCPMCSFG